MASRSFCPSRSNSCSILWLLSKALATSFCRDGQSASWASLQRLLKHAFSSSTPKILEKSSCFVDSGFPSTRRRNLGQGAKNSSGDVSLARGLVVLLLLLLVILLLTR